MKKLSASVVMALLAVGIVASLSSGSSHREAPNISLDPTADNTDVYAFTAQNAPASLTVIANWIPLEDPAGGPNFYNFDPRADYFINIDNTGDGRADIRYRWKFKTRIRDRNSFLYAKPGVTSIKDPDLNLQQSYNVFKETITRPGGRARTTTQRIARNIPVAPNNVGPKTFNGTGGYDAVANQAVRPLNGGGQTFAGQRDEAFYIDLGATFDAINLEGGGTNRVPAGQRGTGNRGGGKDDTAGLNVHSIALQVPESQVTRNGQLVANAKASNAVVGVWSSTERRRLEVQNANFGTGGSGGKVQVSRLANPLVNELVVPLGRKDEYNRSTPNQDAKKFGAFVLKPEVARLLNALFKLGVKETGRTDIVTALLTGIPGVTQISKNPAAADTLKINMGVPPSTTENRFGVIGGDMAGYPNGRRLGDDAVDITLRVVGGFLVPESQGGKKLPLGDGVDQNDKAQLATFPYIPGPASGFDSDPKRAEPPHEPTSGDAPR